jgi:SAM-dependent methyltransferase
MKIDETPDRIENSNDRMREIKSFLDKIALPHKSRVLDVGAGNGLISSYFFDRGMIVTALDYDFPKSTVLDERITKIECDFRNMPSLGSFDVVVLSHVLEHFSNPGLILAQVRALLKPGGILIVVVPRYTPITTEGHWHTGWNVLQLANFLTNGGFDCRNSFFQKTGLSVCGYGIRMKNDWLNEESSLSKTTQYMPELIENFKISQGLYNSDFKYLDSNHAVLESGQNNISLQDLSDGTSLIDFESTESNWWEVYLSKEINSLNLSEKLHLIINFRGESETNVRLIIGFNDGNSLEDPYSSHADTWFSLKPGLTVLDFSQPDFELRKGSFNWGKITSISLGGPAVNGACAMIGKKIS